MIERQRYMDCDKVQHKVTHQLTDTARTAQRWAGVAQPSALEQKTLSRHQGAQ
jgi:hypothetical protein